MSQQPKHIYEFGAYRLDVAERLLPRDGAAVTLQPKIFDLLRVLADDSARSRTASSDDTRSLLAME